jgi:hypothetical protein
MFHPLGKVALLISWSRYAPGRITSTTKYGPSHSGVNLCLPFFVWIQCKTKSPTWKALEWTPWMWYCQRVCWYLLHPSARKQNRSIHTCAQDVQITRMANNMVNRYNISLNYKLESLQNDSWVQKKYYRVAQKSKHWCVFHRHNRRRGRPSLYLLAAAGTLSWTPAFCST